LTGDGGLHIFQTAVKEPTDMITEPIIIYIFIIINLQQHAIITTIPVFLLYRFVIIKVIRW
jgi:hypothetical protein